MIRRDCRCYGQGDEYDEETRRRREEERRIAEKLKHEFPRILAMLAAMAAKVTAEANAKDEPPFR